MFLPMFRTESRLVKCNFIFYLKKITKKPSFHQAMRQWRLNNRLPRRKKLNETSSRSRCVLSDDDQ